MKTKVEYKDSRIRNLYVINLIITCSVITFNLVIRSRTAIEVTIQDGAKHINKVRVYSEYFQLVTICSILILGTVIIISSIYIYRMNLEKSRRLSELSNLFTSVGFNQIKTPSSRLEPSDLVIVDSWNQSVEKILKQANEREQYFARMVHDLNTPLQILKMNAELNALDPDSDTSQIIEDEIKLLERRIKNYLLIEKISYFETPKIEAVNVVELLNKNIKRYNVLSKQITARYHKPDIIYQVDEIMLSHILQNVIENAIKYSDDQQVWIDVFQDRIEISNLASSSLDYDIFKVSQRKFSETGNGLGTEIINAYASLLGYTVFSQKVGEVFKVTIQTGLNDE